MASDVNFTTVDLNYSSVDPDAECLLRFNFVLNSLVAGTICLLGVVGNVVSFAVLLKDTHAPLASLLLRALAFADNAFVCLWFVLFSLRDALLYYGLQQYLATAVWMRWQMILHPMLFVGQTGTVCMTVLIAASRYVAVCQPHRAVVLCNVSVGKVSIAIVACFSVLYNLPRFFEFRLTQQWSTRDNATVYVYEQTTLGESHVYSVVYSNGLYYIISFCLPLLLLAVLNTRLTIAYKAVQHRRREMTSRRDNNDNALTLVMIVVVLVFMLCNAPARLVQILWGYRTHPCLSMRFFLTEMSGVLELLNSSVNFIIYCVCRRQFRSILQHRLCSADVTTTGHRRQVANLPLCSAISAPLMKRQTIVNSTQCAQTHV